MRHTHTIWHRHKSFRKGRVDHDHAIGEGIPPHSDEQGEHKDSEQEYSEDHSHRSLWPGVWTFVVIALVFLSIFFGNMWYETRAELKELKESQAVTISVK